MQEGDPKGGPDIDELFDRPDAASMEGAINKYMEGLGRNALALHRFMDSFLAFLCL